MSHLGRLPRYFCMIRKLKPSDGRWSRRSNAWEAISQKMSKIVERTLDFIELFANQRRPLSLSEMARHLNIPLSSCHDLVHALQGRGYIYELGSRAGFYPTRRLFDLATTIASADPVLQNAEARLSSLRDEVQESVVLIKAIGRRLTYLLSLVTSHALRYQVSVGTEVRSLHATSAGKAYLASLPTAELDEILNGQALAPLTPRTQTVPSALRKELVKSNAKGWFLNAEESVEGLTTISSRFERNNELYIVTVAGPTARMEQKQEEVGTALIAACRDLAAR